MKGLTFLIPKQLGGFLKLDHQQLSKKLEATSERLTILRDKFRTWCAHLPVRVLAGDRQVQKLITDYEKHLSYAIECLSQKGL